MVFEGVPPGSLHGAVVVPRLPAATASADARPGYFFLEIIGSVSKRSLL